MIWLTKIIAWHEHKHELLIHGQTSKSIGQYDFFRVAYSLGI